MSTPKTDVEVLELCRGLIHSTAKTIGGKPDRSVDRAFGRAIKLIRADDAKKGTGNDRRTQNRNPRKAHIR